MQLNQTCNTYLSKIYNASCKNMRKAVKKPLGQQPCSSLPRGSGWSRLVLKLALGSTMHLPSPFSRLSFTPKVPVT